MTSTGATHVVVTNSWQTLRCLVPLGGSKYWGRWGPFPSRPIGEHRKTENIKCKPRTIQPSKSDRHLLNGNILTSPAYACYEPFNVDHILWSERNGYQCTSEGLTRWNVVMHKEPMDHPKSLTLIAEMIRSSGR
jgi:hypothetical protein